MAQEHIRRLISLVRGGPESLTQALSLLNDRLPEMEERLLLDVLVSAPGPLWEPPSVREAAQRVRPANENLRILLRLLTDQRTLSAFSEAYLKTLLKSRNRHALNSVHLPTLIALLHRRGSIDANAVLLPRLHWYSSSSLWEIAILTLRACAPQTLHSPRLARLARYKSIRCKLLIQLCPPERDAQ